MTTFFSLASSEVLTLQICMEKSNYYDPQELSMETFAAAQLEGLQVHRI
jgi:hypothetical protein